MSRMEYGYGSEWHMLHWLGYHRNELNAVIENAIANGKAEASLTARRMLVSATDKSQITWLDMPWSGKPDDRMQNLDWQGVQFIDDASVQGAWGNFWPKSGGAQSWDAIGLRSTPEGHEWLLVEAKAHVGEMVSACKATHPGRKIICAALKETRQALGIAADKAIEDTWLRRYYQYANRLAALYFLRKIAVNDKPIRARLIMVYFTGECMLPKRDCPGSAAQWDSPIEDMYRSLGLLNGNTTFRQPAVKPSLMQYVHEVYLPVSKQ